MIHITHCEEILRKRKHGDINTPGPLVSKSLYEAFCEGEDAEEEVGRRQDVVTYDFAPRQTERVERTTTYRKGMFKDITDEGIAFVINAETQQIEKFSQRRKNKSRGVLI
ncbi:hypothetical protein QYM36_004504 [Artemia franciscana]|uniref:Uncharacterized protein n=1 Tax=Artemia franciscana TaxID=6661 RepID=A0AA88LGF5_ARTSF|nr:hypothetical protein QYM36_004504 [Artemia franciscana]